VSAVYRGHTRAALDAAYNNRAAVPASDRIREERAARSVHTYARARVTRDLAYGSGARQRLDFFHARRPDRPTLAYIHGGYWQSNDKEPNAFVADGALSCDLNVALLEYTLAPQARIGQIVAEIQTALSWLIPRLRSELGAGAGLVVCGHSAGGHLAAMAATLPGIRAALPISGLFDLEPIRLSYLNDALQMDETEASTNSPIKHHLPDVPVSVAVGAAELPELVRQSREYDVALRKNRVPGRELLLPGEDHFSILEHLAHPGGTLCQEAVRLAGG
jgi:arylformamidase